MAEDPPIPIAVIGMGCRFSGGAHSPAELWEMLSEGRSGHGEVPGDRWNWKSFYHPHLEAKEALNSKNGYFLSQDIAAFDPAPFNIPLYEAHAMDPQQRILMEITYEALENAGQSLQDIKGSDTSVHMACYARDYDRMAWKDIPNLHKAQMTGSGEAIISNRISYLFDLKGASMTIDTGCSGSTVGLHLACQGLRAGESRMAIVGGTQLLLTPDQSLQMSMVGMINPDGRCYVFDSRGSGYARGDGVATLILKRLDDAIADGDSVHAVIRASGLNQDGRTAGISLPNPNAQADLMLAVYKKAGLDPFDTPYVECHGTGTQAGDNAETSSVSRIFTRDGAREDELLIGSIKGNIGHLEATSGMSGLIKCILVLKHSMIPPNIDFEIPKKNLRLEERKLKVVQRMTPLPGKGLKRVSVNSFGYGGTNAHVILEEAPISCRGPKYAAKKVFIDMPASNGVQEKNGTHQPKEVNGLQTTNGAHLTNEVGGSNGTKTPSSTKSPTPQLIVLTAKADTSLQIMGDRLLQWASTRQGGDYLPDLSYTLATRRTLWNHRSTFVASSHEELVTALSSKVLRKTRTWMNTPVVFLFTGQGAQWFAMGRELITTESAFMDSFAKSDSILRALGADWSLVEELLKDENVSRIGESEIAQPASTAVQIALVDLLESLKITPQAVVGHSSGEIAAAYAAGALTHEAALEISYRRGFLSEASKLASSSKGAMLAAGLGEDDVTAYIQQTQTGLCCVACVNSPGSTTISGDESAIDELKVLLDSQSIFNRKLKVDTAYHSHHMKKVAEKYLSSISHIQATAPRIAVKFFSSVTGTEKTSGFGPSYWVENLVSKVRYSDALGQVCRAGLLSPGAESGALKYTVNLLLELGPHSALAGPSRQTIKELAPKNFKHHYSPCLVRGQNAIASMLDLAGKVFEHGPKVNMKQVIALSGSENKSVVNDLAPYPWDHSNNYWYESYMSRDHRLRSHPNHDLLGLRVVTSTVHEPVWRNVLSVETLPWLRDHVVDGFLICPGAYYLTMAVEAMRQISIDRQVSGVLSSFKLKNIAFTKAMAVQDQHQNGYWPTVEIQLTLKPIKSLLSDKNGWEQFRILSRSDEGVWSEHCSGQILAQFTSKIDEVEGTREADFTNASQLAALRAITDRCTVHIEKEELYKELAAGGNAFGSTFANVTDVIIGQEGEAFVGVANITVPDVAAAMPREWQQPHLMHPITFDAFFHTAIPLYRRNFNPGALMPTSMSELSISADFPSIAGTKLVCTTRLVSDGGRSATSDCVIFKENEDSSLTQVCEFKEVTLKIVGEDQDDQEDETAPFYRKHSYQIKWDADLDSISPKSLSVGALAKDSSLAVEYLKLLAFKKPHMTILQLGADSGELTLSLLRCLHRVEGPLLDRYHFTNSSADKFEQAKELLADWTAHLDFKTLEISQDLVEQGYELGSYDLVVASDALSGESSLDKATSNIRKLLKPGGHFLLIKTPKFVPVEDSSDSESGVLVESTKEGSSILSENQWHAVLSSTGFEGAQLVEDPTGVSSFIVSRAIDAPIIPSAPQHVEIIAASQSPAVQALVSELSSSLKLRGLEASVISWSSHVTPQPTTVYVVVDDVQQPLLVDPTDTLYSQIVNLLTTGKSLLWISTQADSATTMNPVKGMITGLARVARKESAITLVTFDVQQTIAEDRSKLVDALSRTLFNTFCPSSEAFTSIEYEYAFKDNKLLIPRISTDGKFNAWVDKAKNKGQQEIGLYKQPDRPLKLHVGVPGLLSTLQFVDDELALLPLQQDELEIDAMAYGVNFKEVFIAMGQMQPHVRMPAECAGIVTAVGSNLASQYKVGDRVCGRDGSPFASRARVKGFTVSPMPDGMSFAEGASISVIFGTAYYCLMEVARLQKGQTVLIHAASGGVGQAAIQLAKHVGAEIYATCGSTAKRQLLIDNFGIPEDHIFSTRTRTFKQGILRMTGDRGVDVVLNSLAGDWLQDSLSIVAPLGIFVEIGKADIYKKSGLNMVPFDKNIGFHAVDMTVLDKLRPEEQRERFNKVMKMFERGELKPVSPITTMPMTNIEEAFRLIQAHKHAGKVVMVADEDTLVQVVLPKPPALKLKKDATYIIAGGLGDLGQRIARWMAAHGAGHIVTLSRRKADNKDYKIFEEELRKLGAELHLIACDVTQSSSVEEVSAKCLATLPPVKGIVHAGMVLRDHPLEKMTHEDWMTSTKPKVAGTLNLDAVFAVDDNLDFFILLSSITSIVGNPGQGNYAAGNSFQDAFAQSKAGSKTRYISLNLGAVDGTLAITSLPIRQQEIMRQGTILMSFEELFKVLEYTMGPQAIEDGCIQSILGFDRRTLENIHDELNLANPLFSHVPYLGAENVAAADATSGSTDIAKSLRDAKTSEQAKEVIINAVTERFSLFSARPKDEISPDAKLSDVGMDSLVAIELKNWATKTFQSALQTSEVVDAFSIATLGATIASRSKLISKKLGGIGGDADDNDAADAPVAIIEDKKSALVRNHPFECCHMQKDLSKLPLLDLDTLLQNCLDTNRQFCSDEEWDSLCRDVEETKKPGSIAQQVYAQISKRAADPEIENWIEEWYLKMNYTEKRRTLSPYSNFIGMHPSPRGNEQQAQRAAIIAVTAFKCKQDLDNGKWEPLQYLGTYNCADSWQYLYNTTRIPHAGGDEIVRYPGNDYLVVFHRGHVYKVMLTEGGANVSFEKLKATFQLIVDTEKADSWVSILTADERNSWAHWHEIVQSTSEANAEYLRTIDAAAFLICLDDVTPVTPKERVENVILGDGFNRWSDKSIAFVVCRNGASGTYVEHGPIDSMTLTRLQTAISTSITSSDEHPEFNRPAYSGPIALDEYTCTTTTEIDGQISSVRQKRFETAAKHEYCDVWQNSFGKDVLLARGYPIKGIFDVLIQLAIFYYFGQNRPVWEAVSMQHFHKGRPDCVQVVSPTISTFCSTADDVTLPPSMRLQRLLDAAHDYNLTIKKASTGRFCYFRTLFVMEKIALDAGLPVPPIITNKAFQKYNNSEIMPSASDGLSPESGFVLDNENFLWMTYFITEDASHYSLTGGKNRTEKFAACLMRAAATIKGLIDSA